MMKILFQTPYIPLDLKGNVDFLMGD